MAWTPNDYEFVRNACKGEYVPRVVWEHAVRLREALGLMRQAQKGKRFGGSPHEDAGYRMRIVESVDKLLDDTAYLEGDDD